jgi:hypothetical protein
VQSSLLARRTTLDSSTPMPAVCAASATTAAASATTAGAATTAA